jgi:hypothetical protein
MPAKTDTTIPRHCGANDAYITITKTKKAKASHLRQLLLMVPRQKLVRHCSNTRQHARRCGYQTGSGQPKSERIRRHATDCQKVCVFHSACGLRVNISQDLQNICLFYRETQCSHGNLWAVRPHFRANDPPQTVATTPCLLSDLEFVIVQLARFLRVKQIKGFSNFRLLVVGQLGSCLPGEPQWARVHVKQRSCKVGSPTTGKPSMCQSITRRRGKPADGSEERSERREKDIAHRFRMGSRPKTSLQLYRDCLRLVKHVAGTSVRALLLRACLLCMQVLVMHPVVHCSHAEPESGNAADNCQEPVPSQC